MSPSSGPLLFLILFIVGWIAQPSFCSAESNTQFVQELRNKGWNDTALEFLDWVVQKPNLESGFKNRIPYERALTLAAQARATRSQKQRTSRLAKAAEELAAVAKKTPQADFAIDSLGESSKLYYQLALTELARGGKLPAQAQRQRDEAMKTARGWFEKAQATSEQLLKLAEQGLAALPKAAQANNLQKAERRQLRSLLAEYQFRIANYKFEQAATFSSGSADETKKLKAAIKEFDALFDEYDLDAPVGYLSRVLQGRCYQQMGKYEEAIGCYDDLIAVPTANAEFRKATARAHRYRTESYIKLKEFDKAITDARAWLKRAESNERDQPEWLELAYRIADALEAKSKADGTGSKSDVRVLLRDVSQSPNEFQQEARLRLVSAGGGDAKPANLKTFEDARAAGQNAFDMMRSAQLAANLAKENNPSAVEELEQSVLANAATAQLAFEAALDLADSQTATEDVNAVRYYLCWMYWDQGRLQEAAVLGQHLAERFPKSTYQSGAAKVALAAYEKLYNHSLSGAGKSGNAYLSQQLANLARAVAQRSPESPEASAAVNLLMKIALSDNRIEDAQALLEKLPAGNRAAAQLALGTSLWQQYSAASGTEGKASSETINLRKQASSLLKQGYQGQAKAGAPSASSLVGILYYASLKLSEGDANAALKVLEHKNVGPLTLVEDGAAAAKSAKFIEEVYKVALRASLTSQPPRREQAQELMAALEETAGGSKKGTSDLTKIYLSLAQQMQSQMKQLKAEGKDDQANSVAKAFEDVLDRVSSRDDADSWAIRNWVAQMNLQLGEGLEGAASKRYIERAKQAYNAILLSAAQDKSYAPKPSSLLAVRKRLADCERALGNFDQALNQYTEILKKKAGQLELQIAAAETLQRQGFEQKKPQLLDQAIRGAKPQANKKNLIWGWLRLAAVADHYKRKFQSAGPEGAARVKQYESLFFQARFNIAKARYQVAKISPAGKQKAQLAAAKKNIVSMKNLYPQLGGPQWKGAFEELLRQIENEM
ncbi:MAG: hypothetical protein RIB44_12480 [Lacipirellulaceae bacterium]